MMLRLAQQRFDMRFDGHIKEANAYLGYEFFISGMVVKGKGRGREMKIPTANIEVNDAQKIIPMSGVYSVGVSVNGENYDGLLNIGMNPTFGDNDTPSIEVHILDFQEDIYVQSIRVFFRDRIRDEIKFESKEDLLKQINIDIESSKKSL